MKRIQSACLEQTIRFVMKDDIPREEARQMVQTEYRHYLEQMDRNRTGYKVLERLGEFTLLECRLKTGRTHQIRVHMASIHHPVAGDPVYGPHNCITSLHGQCLHAKTLGFIHPITGEQLRFDSELPDYFTHFLATLRRKNT